MQFWVGVTDKDWFDHLRALAPDEVNFWQPSSKPIGGFTTTGMPFLFKLHAPHHYIVGGAFFVRFSSLPARLAWDAFGVKNGVSDYAMLRARADKYRRSNGGDPEIGCNVLTAPVFLDRDQWIEVPASWARNIVRGRRYDTAEREGAELWGAFVLRAGGAAKAVETPRFGVEFLTRARLGQGAFRVLVTEAYTRRCAISGERTLPVLQAAHIRPYSEEGPHAVSNGLLLRSDLHTLFDAGYVTVTDRYRIEVSPRIREEFQNGREYYQYHGRSLVATPNEYLERPSIENLRWHNKRHEHML